MIYFENETWESERTEELKHSGPELDKWASSKNQDVILLYYAACAAMVEEEQKHFIFESLEGG